MLSMKKIVMMALLGLCMLVSMAMAEKDYYKIMGLKKTATE